MAIDSSKVAAVAAAITSKINSLISTHNTSSSAHNQGSANGNKNVVTDSSGNITTEAKPTIPTGSSTATDIKMNGSQAAGTSSNFAKADHVHPTDTSRAAASHTHGNLSNDGKVGSTSGKIITTGTGGAIQASDSITKSQISDFPSTMTPSSHTHGSITNDGKIGSDSGKIITTGTGGALQASSTITKSMISDFPTTMTPASHEHAASEVKDSTAHSNIGSAANATQAAINTAVDTALGNLTTSLTSIELVTVVSSLGTASASTMNKMYLVAESSGKTNDNYEIYITVRTGTSPNYSYAWEKVDTTRIDLSSYAQTNDINDALDTLAETIYPTA